MQKTCVMTGPWLCSLLALCAAPALAVNKCTDAKTGKVNYTDAVCPKDQADTKMEWKPSSTTNTVGAFANGGTQREPDRDLKLPPQGSALLDLYRRWIDAERLAGATARVALATPVAALQDLGRQVTALQVPVCMGPARDALTRLVRASADVHIQFMLKDEFSPIIYKRVDRDKMIRDFETEATSARC